MGLRCISLDDTFQAKRQNMGLTHVNPAMAQVGQHIRTVWLASSVVLLVIFGYCRVYMRRTNA